MSARRERRRAEVTGLELNWQRDRIMLVGCQDTCGSAGTPRSHFPDGRSALAEGPEESFLIFSSRLAQ